jgi:hypothetical protein
MICSWHKDIYINNIVMKFNQLLSKINEQMNVGSGTAPARGAIQRVKELSNKPRLPPINSLKYGPVRTESVEPGKELAIRPKSEITTTNQPPNPNLPVLGGQIGRVRVRVTGTTANQLPGSTTPPKSRGDMIRALNAYRTGSRMGMGPVNPGGNLDIRG